MFAVDQERDLLAPVDRAALSDLETIALLEARQRLINHLMAERAADIVEVARRHGGSPVEEADRYGEFFPLEVGAALHLTRRTASAEVELAFELVERLPAVWEQLRSGDIDWARARVIAHGVEHVDSDRTARRVVDRVLPAAPGLTTGQLAARVRRACLDFDPQDAKRRFERSVDDRRVEIWPRNDGTGDLVATGLPPDRLNQAFDHIDRLAQGLRDGRSLDQRRADVMLDLLTGRAIADPGTDLVVTVDLETLVGLAENPAEIPGWGPVITELARTALEADDSGRLRIRVADSDRVAEVKTRRPTSAQRRHILAREATCRFPGCRRPSQRSDLDHTIRWVDGGTTAVGNLLPLCRFHHRAKDEGRWRYEANPDRSVTWTSPVGATYVVPARGP